MTDTSVLCGTRQGSDTDGLTFHSGRMRPARARSGLAQVRALPRLGILKGLIEEDRMAELTKVPSVRSVERSNSRHRGRLCNKKHACPLSRFRFTRPTQSTEANFLIDDDWPPLSGPGGMLV